MMIPTIHLNGTSHDDLYAANIAARRALRVAIEKIQADAPNARDFYPQGHDAYARARGEHVNRLQLLEIIDSELQEITIGIVSQRR